MSFLFIITCLTISNNISDSIISRYIIILFLTNRTVCFQYISRRYKTNIVLLDIIYCAVTTVDAYIFYRRCSVFHFDSYFLSVWSKIIGSVGCSLMGKIVYFPSNWIFLCHWYARVSFWRVCLYKIIIVCILLLFRYLYDELLLWLPCKVLRRRRLLGFMVPPPLDIGKCFGDSISNIPQGHV